MAYYYHVLIKEIIFIYETNVFRNIQQKENIIKNMINVFVIEKC